jgi:hypothetical protein
LKCLSSVYSFNEPGERRPVPNLWQFVGPLRRRAKVYVQPLLPAFGIVVLMHAAVRGCIGIDAHRLESPLLEERAGPSLPGEHNAI